MGTVLKNFCREKADKRSGNMRYKRVLAMTLCLAMIVGLGACSGKSKKPKHKTNPIVTIEMENGDIIKAELYPNIAPTTVDNFVTLVQKGFYDGLTFHRIAKDFVIQGGDPLGTGYGGPGYCIKGEFDANGHENPLKHMRGVLSMARSDLYDSAGSQFFIVLKDSPALDGLYAAFGKVIEGMEVVDKIASVETKNEKPVTPQVMKKVTVETFGEEYDEPEKLLEY